MKITRKAVQDLVDEINKSALNRKFEVDFALKRIILVEDNDTYCMKRMTIATGDMSLTAMFWWLHGYKTALKPEIRVVA